MNLHSALSLARCNAEVIPKLGDVLKLAALTMHLPLFCAGHILFHGPKEECLAFFQTLGFDIPARKGIPDFLQEVSGRKDQQVQSDMLLVFAIDLAWR